jgi:hypothetical protein
MSDIEWKETNSLAGHFLRIVEDCKVRSLDDKISCSQLTCQFAAQSKFL